MTDRVAWAALWAVALAAAGTARGASDDPSEFFELKVRPTLAGTCFRCHGGQKTSGGLRVDSRAALLKGGDGGPAVVPGDPDASPLVRAVTHSDDAPKMPPDARLSDAVVADLTAWVRSGARWPDTPNASKGFQATAHWAFAPVRETDPPDDPSGWAATPVDRFVAARWRAEGLTPVGAADRRTLVRRVTFDLTGLPPTLSETAAFLSDNRPDAYERVVERLLASPAYGERWGRHWLDVARYADTAGDNADYPVPEAFKYRDYVIDSVNADLPFDEFVREQIAGDLLAADGPPARYAGRVAATGFLALSRRYATAPYELWHLTLEDTVETTSRAFLGLSFRCARCHDHKFDPVTQSDYYALYGTFASTTFPYAGSEEFQSMDRPREHFAALVPPAEAGREFEKYRARLARFDADLKAAEADAAKPAAPPAAKSRVAAIKAERAVLRRPGLPAGLPAAYAVTEGKPADAPVQRGGDPSKPGPVVPRGAPAFLSKHGTPPPPVPSHASGRRELAEWLTRPDHPLTPRVIVNRVWHHHFGRGVVATPGNLGLRGDPPSHPELLDWLAARFVAGGWSLKGLHRLIVTSKVYQLSSRHDEASAAKDPANRFLWHFARRRLDAEALRDAMLAAGGGLDRSRPGSHPFPPIRDWHWTQHNPFKAVYPSDRRTVYLMTQRLQRHPYLALFDGPDTNATTDARTRATVPLQALYLRNDPFVTARAAAFATRLAAEAPEPSDRVDLAAELAWNRPPTGDERERLLGYVRRYTAAGGPGAESGAWQSLARLMLTCNEFLYVE